MNFYIIIISLLGFGLALLAAAGTAETGARADDRGLPDVTDGDWLPPERK